MFVGSVEINRLSFNTWKTNKYDETYKEQFRKMTDEEIERHIAFKKLEM